MQQTAEARHRYSEFESLRLNLVKLYPTLIIPPIPSKQTIGDYATKQAKAKEDATMIARRKRMLQTFLNRVARHPILSNEHVFHRFLEGEVSWVRQVLVLCYAILDHIVDRSAQFTTAVIAPKEYPKGSFTQPYRSERIPCLRSTSQSDGNASFAKPRPTLHRFRSVHEQVRKPPRWPDGKSYTPDTKAVVRYDVSLHPLYSLNNLYIHDAETAQDYSELGAALNGFSLNESGALATAMEKTGQAVDASYMSTTRLVRLFHRPLPISFVLLLTSSQLQELEQNFSEPLHEYTQFATIIKKLLAYRHQKHVQYEMTQDGLENKREMLEEYEKSEREAKRLDEALARGRVNGLTNSQSEGQSSENPDEPGSVYLPPHPGPSPYKRRAPGMGLLNALSYTLHGMMDVDPETARRNSIGKTRETISQVSSSDCLTVIF